MAETSGLGALGGLAGLAGPIGSLVGAGVGAIDANQQKKKALSANRPKRRRLTRIQRYLEERQQKKAMALASLGQAASEFGASRL